MVLSQAVYEDDEGNASAHRVDVLAHALLYYAFTTKKKTTYVLKII